MDSDDSANADKPQRLMDGKIYKVFVSSTYDDLREERAVVERALLQLDCLPVGMELFPAADEETWDFIKSQIDDSDYYVVMIAGRYGSVAPDGISFTEKEYDYAIANKKPAIGFVHGRPGSIPFERTEQQEERRAKLQAFIQKVKQRPVRPFTTPHELALEVTTSFVKLIKGRPAEGYVRSSEAVDFKRYSILLEENNALKEQLKVQTIETAPFKGHDRNLKLKIEVWPVGKVNAKQLEVEKTLGAIFSVIAEAILQENVEPRLLASAAEWMVKPLLEGTPKLGEHTYKFQDESIALIRRQLQLYDLIEISHETMTEPTLFNKTTTHTYTVWKLTDYGRRQLRNISGE